jgi:glycosyltransferase involved in cell wall biosynthesis
MLRYRRAAPRDTDVVHFQWLTVPRLDLRLLPDRPTVLTIHDPLERGRTPLRAPAFASVDAIVVHSEYAKQAVIAQHGVDDDRIHVIHHGVLGAGALGEKPVPSTGFPPSVPHELNDTGEPVVLSYGLIRPYKGIETLLQAWRGIENAQLWVVGRPMMDVAQLTAAAPPGVKIVARFVTPEEERALFERADIVVLPYERSERFGFSGVLATALGYAKAIVLSDVGGLSEVGSDPTHPVARLVTPGDAAALHAALGELIADGEARGRLAAAAAHAAATTYSWDAAAAATLALYETIARK